MSMGIAHPPVHGRCRSRLDPNPTHLRVRVGLGSGQSGFRRSLLRQDLKRLKGVSLPRSGAHRKLTAEDRDSVYDAIQNRPDITREDLLAEVDYRVKAMSIQRLTHDMGLRKWRKMNRPYLTPIHAAKCLAWALAYRHFTPEDWKRVFWSDETTIERGYGARKEWTSIPPRYQLQERESGIQMTPSKGKQTKQMFWACFRRSAKDWFNSFIRRSYRGS
ncbi:hypothetical protein N7476_004763 [Penicillium atrosanguineum]|uniref:Transposase Tc1-like domain-containing protein n=1 Tax=Penicillium atrosanguineum TaxID=1132637 RepID=A0A9W9U4Z5_9EURO|nr:hypothetical protein N7476_004763 [Penicillium atrosanguineum]